MLSRCGWNQKSYNFQQTSQKISCQKDKKDKGLRNDLFFAVFFSIFQILQAVFWTQRCAEVAHCARCAARQISKDTRPHSGRFWLILSKNY